LISMLGKCIAILLCSASALRHSVVQGPTLLENIPVNCIPSVASDFGSLLSNANSWMDFFKNVSDSVREECEANYTETDAQQKCQSKGFGPKLAEEAKRVRAEIFWGFTSLGETLTDFYVTHARCHRLDCATIMGEQKTVEPAQVEQIWDKESWSFFWYALAQGLGVIALSWELTKSTCLNGLDKSGSAVTPELTQGVLEFLQALLMRFQNAKKKSVELDEAAATGEKKGTQTSAASAEGAADVAFQALKNIVEGLTDTINSWIPDVQKDKIRTVERSLRFCEGVKTNLVRMVQETYARVTGLFSCHSLLESLLRKQGNSMICQLNSEMCSPSLALNYPWEDVSRYVKKSFRDGKKSLEDVSRNVKKSFGDGKKSLVDGMKSSWDGMKSSWEKRNWSKR